MAEHPDLSYWQIIGGAIAGILTGAGAVFGAKKRVRTTAGDKVRTEIRSLQDTVLTMGKDIQAMQEVLRQQQSLLTRMDEEHDVVIAELFREVRSIGLTLREVTTDLKHALKQKGAE